MVAVERRHLRCLPDKEKALREDRRDSSQMDGPERTLKELVTESPSPLHLKIANGLSSCIVFVLAKLFGWMAYDTKYFHGRWFQYFYSPGWRWVFNGMLAKLFKGTGRGIPWPVSSQGAFGTNIDFELDDINLFQGPVYYQTMGDARITFGKGVMIARGCALITANHDPLNPTCHADPESIELGDETWLGTNVVVMPGVKLGPRTVVGANAVVTKSFPEGHCVLAGVPAKKIKSAPVTQESA